MSDRRTEASRARRRPRVRTLIGCAVLVVGAIVAGSLTGVASAAPAPAPHDAARSASTCGGPSMRPGATITRSVTVNGLVRTYRVHVPRTYTGRQRVPMILAFHGHAERGATFERYTGLSALPAVVVYPDGLRGTDHRFSWQGAPYSSPRADDVAFTRAILRAMAATACVDRARTYAVGRSNGGGMVALLACRMPAGFAGFATVSAAVYGRFATGCGHGPPISLIDFHGTADRVIGYDGGTRYGERYLSSSAWLQRWVDRAGCVDAPVILPVNQVVDTVTWPLCRGTGHPVVHYRIRGGSHRWPGSTGNRAAGSISDTISATELIWQFFRTAPRLGSS